jgi:hypothetical protein
MKTKLTVIKRAALLLLLSTLNYQLSTFAQGTASTYQGRLNDGANVANGAYDLTFALFNVVSGVGQVGNTLTNSATTVSNGLFTVTLDFGANFPGADRWLEIGVRTNGGATFTNLDPRQKITPSPYAIYAAGASAAGISGTIPAANLTGTYGSAVTFSNAANSFSGNGTGLTNVNAATLGGLNSSNFWRTTGNGGTTAGVNFLGTTDNQPLEIKVNGLRALRLEDNGDSTSDTDTTPDGAPNVIGGSPANFVGAGIVGATIAGGGATNFDGIARPNSVLSDFGAVGGGSANRIAPSAFASTIAGGAANSIGTNAIYTTIGGGYANKIATDALFATIAGGTFNDIGNSDDSVISGGGNNRIGTNSPSSVISGGDNNNIAANSLNVTIAGGIFNDIGTNSNSSAIGGGNNNNISANSAFATIPGGDNNAATNYAFAAGRRAKANHRGAFVWADSQAADFASTASNQFLIRASGGVGINTTTPAAALDVNGTVSATQIFVDAGSASAPGLSFNGDSDTGIFSPLANTVAVVTGGSERLRVASNGGVGIGTTSPSRELEIQHAGDTEIGLKSTDTGGHLWTLQSSAASGSANLDASFQIIDRTLGGSRLLIGTNGNVGIGTSSPSEKLHVIGNILASGTITGSSDRNVKENFTPVNPRDVLEKVSALPITQWNYKADSGVRHLGPMAQDFYSAFAVGMDDKHISMVDADGVAMAAIQGLNQKFEEELKRRDAENAELKRRLEKLEQLMNHKLNGGAK